ncbi:outer membrane protein assembly factor BamB family protein [Streptomyces sp. H27-D2]|uniref:outer membrane protein assembly factor BamB family protein n=1 Tax=Streptomyces sp. H27-D2 TaxID=3046304 RepID=UPI002DB5FF10|nr:PQQ-binding-like beta-propeller repeat protein [Streptomyces sp. H27-D2]MEC4019169.1 PQQ-binding-like beta-propeller repeat protein [Streptomyces sp. H27-D2]
MVALLLAGVGGAYVALGGGDDSGSDTSGGRASTPGGIAWRAQPRTEPSKGSNVAPGTWFTEKLVVKAEPDMVTAYDIKTGKKAWAFILDGPLCAASGESEGDRALIAYELGDHTCHGLTVINLREGSRDWRNMFVDFTEPGTQLTPGKWKTPPALAVSGGYGLVSWSGGERVVDLDNGDMVLKTKRKSCGGVRAAGGAQFLVASDCQSRSTVRALDPEDWKHPKWTWRAPKNSYLHEIVSTTPTVLATGDNSTRPTELTVLSETNGIERSRVRIDEEVELTGCGGPGPSCVGVLISGDAAYVQGRGMTSAYDLATGRRQWANKADADRQGVPVSIDGDELVTYSTGTIDRPGQLRYVNTTTGKTERTVSHSKSSRRAEWDLWDSRGAVPYLKGKRLLLVQRGVIESVDTDVILAIEEQ